MADEIVVHGLQELLRTMEGLPLAMKRVLIVRALRKAAQPILDRMKTLAPNDPKTPGSRVRDNLTFNVTDQTADGASAFIGFTSKAFFAGFAEIGTRHQKKTPFVGPAFDQTEEEAMRLLSETLGDSIEEAWAQNG